ncbi:MAG: hypothetical protein ACT4OD_02830 [Candidatus Nitrosotenuis sp.]
MYQKLILIPTVLFVLLIPNIAHGQESQNQSDAPVTYDVGIQLENIGFINRQSGSYDLIFWVTLRSDEIDFTKNPPPEYFDFTNGYVDEISGISTEPHFHKFKVRGVFYNAINFRNYPFENIDLAIHMEPYYPNTEDKLVFTVNERYSGMSDSETISVPGWDIGTPFFIANSEKYPWGNFANFEAHYPVGTTAFSAFMKKLFPIVVLMGFSFASFALSPKNLAERLGMISAALLSSVFFHTGFLLSELPPLGYMTLADKIMVVAYGLFVMCLIPILLTKYSSEIKKQEFTLTQQLALDKKIVIATPIILFIMFTVVYFAL